MNPSGHPEHNRDQRSVEPSSFERDVAELSPVRLGEHERLRIRLAQAEVNSGGHYIAPNSRVLVLYDENPRLGADLINQATSRIQGYLRGNGVPCEVICEGLYFRAKTNHFIFIATLENQNGRGGEEVLLPYQRVMTNGFEVERIQNGALLQVTLKPYINADKVVFEAMEYPDLDFYENLTRDFGETGEISLQAGVEHSNEAPALDSVKKFSDALDASWSEAQSKKFTHLKDPASLCEYSISTSLHLAEGAFRECLSNATNGMGLLHEELLRHYSKEAYRQAIGNELYRTKATPASQFYWIERNHPEREFRASLTCEEWGPKGAFVAFELAGPLLHSPLQARIRYSSSRGTFALIS